MPMHLSMQGRASSTVLHGSPTGVLKPPAPLTMRHSLGAMPTDREAIELALLLRHSAPTLARAHSPTVSAKHVPESILMLTEVRVGDVTARDSHCVYALEVDSGFEHHVVHKRYSEIRDFRAALLQAVSEKKHHCGHGPCAQIAQLTQIKFPRRRLRIPGLQREANLMVAKERVPLLERFLQAMLRVYRMATRRQMRGCTNSQCVLLGMIKRFLNVSEPVIPEQDTTDPTAETTTTHTVVPPTAVAVPSMPQGFPELTHPTLYGKKQSSLFSIAEDPEPVAAFD